MVSKPQTYINLSGNAVEEMFFIKEIDPERFISNIFIVYDDADLPMHQIRIKNGYGSGGHNGLRDINIALSKIRKKNNVESKKIALGCNNSARKRIKLNDYVLKVMSKADLDLWQKNLQAWIPAFIEGLDVSFLT